MARHGGPFSSNLPLTNWTSRRYELGAPRRLRASNGTIGREPNGARGDPGQGLIGARTLLISCSGPCWDPGDYTPNPHTPNRLRPWRRSSSVGSSRAVFLVAEVNMGGRVSIFSATSLGGTLSVSGGPGWGFGGRPSRGSRVGDGVGLSRWTEKEKQLGDVVRSPSIW